MTEGWALRITIFETAMTLSRFSLKCDPVEWPLDDLIWILYTIQFAKMLEETDHDQVAKRVGQANKRPG